MGVYIYQNDATPYLDVYNYVDEMYIDFEMYDFYYFTYYCESCQVHWFFNTKSRRYVL